ncbi:protein canopy-1 isoform X2 [Electrophorus electricus]|uniref:protein canopy-1 isoform X2 n=1 Tax=Electrophorus electricus TaxID=8005 RepID=UPI0015D05890|nr:protein canopy-1 isoform X2 [Electrophorus electricus]
MTPRCLPCTWLLLTTNPPHSLPPALGPILLVRPPRSPLPGEAKGWEQGCTLTCLDATAWFCSVAKVPLARSETHLSELLERVCESMSDYALYEDPDTTEKRYRRFAPRNNDGGNFPDFKHFKFEGPEGSNSLKFACETIVEELEDDIVSLFTHADTHVAQKLCSELSGHCKSSAFQHSEL